MRKFSKLLDVLRDPMRKVKGVFLFYRNVYYDHTQTLCIFESQPHIPKWSMHRSQAQRDNPSAKSPKYIWILAESRERILFYIRNQERGFSPNWTVFFFSFLRLVLYVYLFSFLLDFIINFLTIILQMIFHILIYTQMLMFINWCSGCGSKFTSVNIYTSLSDKHSLVLIDSDRPIIVNCSCIVSCPHRKMFYQSVAWKLIV